MPYSTFETDKKYLTEKFRSPVFPSDSGKDNEFLRNGIVDFAHSLGDLPYPVIKARCYEHICQEIAIDLSSHDYFPAFGCYNRNRRPLDPLLYSREAMVNEKYHKETNPVIQQRNASGLLAYWKDFDHSVPDWDTVLKLGFTGLRDRARKFRAEREKRGEEDKESAAYFDGLDITICATIDLIKRIIVYGETHYADIPRIRETLVSLKQLTIGAPRNTYEVFQLMYLYFICCEHIDHMQVRSLGNFDRLIYPWWRNDIENGTYTEEKLRELLACFLMQWGSINNYWGQPVYLGGTKADGTTEINELSYIFLDVHGKLEITTPKIQIKVAKNTPESLIKKAMELIRKGHNSIVFVSEDGIRDAMMGMGFSEEEARTCDVKGCYEFAPRGTGNITCSSHINLLKPFELIFNDGTDPATGFHVECHAKRLSEIRNFSDFYNAYIAYLTENIHVSLKCCTDLEKYLHEINPGNLYSITIENSLRNALDAFSRGCLYNNTAVLLVGIGTMTDAFCAVKEFVFEKKEVTLEEMHNILLSDWSGYEKLRTRILHSPNKYGNGIKEVDFYAKQIVHYCSTIINLHPNGRGGVFVTSGHTAKQYFDLGKKTGATPDGRKAGMEMSKNLSPTMGMDRNGVTALVRSATQINTQDLPDDYPLDVLMHPATVQGDDGLDAMTAVMRTYMDRGGIAVHFNIFDADVLEDAQRHPENYENLQVRVCGWNVRFNDMPKVEQDAFITRAKNAAE